MALIIFTPLKYYIPGYDDLKIGRDYQQMKYRVDSLERQVGYQANYIDNIKKVLSGNTPATLDTVQLKPSSSSLRKKIYLMIKIDMIVKRN